MPRVRPGVKKSPKITKIFFPLDNHAYKLENVVDCSTIQRPCQKIEYFLNVDQGAAEGMSRLTSFDITFEKELVTYIEDILPMIGKVLFEKLVEPLDFF